MTLRLHSLIASPAALAACLAGWAATNESTAQEAAPAGRTTAVEWVQTIQGPASGESGVAMAVEAGGAIFIAGHHGGLDTDGDGAIDVAADGTDPLFLKVSPDGKVLWIRAPMAPGYNAGSGIALDGQGGAYGTGSFQDRLSFGSAHVLRGGGNSDGFLARYDAEGELLWVRAVAGGGNQSMLGISSDRAGNAYVAGFGGGSFTFEEEGDLFEARGKAAAFVASYDPRGRLRWARVSGTPAASYARTIAVAPDGHVIVAGDATDGPVDLDGDGREDLPPRKGQLGFVARFSPEGRLAGAWPIASAGSVLFTGIAFANDGDLVVSGTLTAPADFDADGTPDAEVRSGGATSAFLARYAPAGTLRWVRSYTMDGAWNVASDGKRFVVSGFVRGPRDLDENGTVERHAADAKRDSDLAVLILSEEGRPLDVWIAPGRGNDHARAAAFVPGQPAVYVTGFLQLTADFTGEGENAGRWIRCDALGDLFLARYRLR